MPFDSLGESSGKSSFRSSSRLSSKDGERSLKMENIVWKRPKELNPKSRLLNGGKMFRGDLVEGIRGTSLFGAACSALALKHELLFQVMPDDQCPIAFEDDWGIYKFRFWRFGSWTEVTIDDKLPVIGGDLLYTHTVENDEHWMCLMEKAYAKFNGCYDIINKIPLGDMLQHLTGGITETINLAGFDNEGSEADSMGFYLEKCFQKRSLILATAVRSKDGMMLGLESDFPYIITRVKRRTREHPLLVCLYSPFGCCSWSGPWGRQSKEWEHYSHDDVYNTGLINESEFDFWISMADVMVYFETLYITHQAFDKITVFQGPVQEFDPSTFTSVRCGLFGNWIKDKTDGGAPNNVKFLTHNTQYLISQTCHEEALCMISLVQRFRPRNTPHEGFMCIGFTVFKVPENIQYRMIDLKDPPIAIATYSFKESVTVKVNLQPGNYVIIPTPYYPGVPGEYLLRCISAENLNIRLLKAVPSSVTKKQIVDVELVLGEKFPDITNSHEADPGQEVYCVIVCGKEKCSVPVRYGCNPIWNTSATFHVKNPYNKTIKVQVWYRPDKNVKIKEDMCVAETNKLPIMVGDYKVKSRLMFVKRHRHKSTNLISRATTKLNKGSASKCAGFIVLLIRHKPTENVSNATKPIGQSCLTSDVSTVQQGLKCNEVHFLSSDGNIHHKSARDSEIINSSGNISPPRYSIKNSKPSSLCNSQSCEGLNHELNTVSTKNCESKCEPCDMDEDHLVFGHRDISSYDSPEDKDFEGINFSHEDRSPLLLNADTESISPEQYLPLQTLTSEQLVRSKSSLSQTRTPELSHQSTNRSSPNSENRMENSNQYLQTNL